MNTNKTFEQHWEESTGTLFVNRVQMDLLKKKAEKAWNAALASIVQEPGLTEEELVRVLMDIGMYGEKSMPGPIVAAQEILKAGRIPASNPDDQERLKNYEAVLRFIGAPEIICTGEMGQLAELDEDDMAWAREQAKKIVPTPQQEGGLTRDTVDKWVYSAVGGDCKVESAIDTLWTRHTQALEAKEAEVRGIGSSALYTANLRVDQLEQELAEAKSTLETKTTNNAMLSAECTRYAQRVERMLDEIAEAKKGRYAIDWSKAQPHHIGVVVEFTGATESDEAGYPWYIAYIPRPQPEVPTVEAMMEAIVEKYYVDHQGELPAKGHDALLADAWAYTAREREKVESMESLWRRDCKGGVK